MGQFGTIALILLFGVGFSLYAGSLGLGIDIGVGFTEFVNLINNFTIDSLLDLVLNAISNPINAAALLAVTGVSIITGNTARFTFAIAMLLGVTQILFLPFAFTTAATATIPETIRFLVQGFFSLLLVIATMSFVMERDF